MSKTVRRLTLLIMATVLLLLAQPVSSQNDLNITDLGALVNLGSPTDVNDRGQVVGWHTPEGVGKAHFLWTPEQGWVALPGRGLGYTYVNELTQVATDLIIEPTKTEPILWDGGEITTLGSLGGRKGQPRDINEAGQVAGESRTAVDMAHAFRWAPQGGMLDLGTLGGGQSSAVAMNNLGWVVGDSFTGSGENHAFLWTPSEGMVDLGTLGGDSSWASDVNELGQIVGTSSTTAGEKHAFLWTKEGGMIDLGLLGGSYSGATDINESGEVVGYSNTDSGAKNAFLWTPGGGMRGLGTLGGPDSRAVRVSNSGQVVGTSSLATGESRGFLWTLSTGLLDLGTLPGGANSVAVDINENRQAVGWSDTATGERHVVLWNVANVVLSPAEQIQALIDNVAGLVDDGTLSQGNANALVQKLENAARQLDQEQLSAVCGQLRAFVNQVEAYTKSGQLPQDIGAELISLANSVIDELCG